MTKIKDVAAACGVSPTTVSFVLNNSGAVGEETRQRVLQAAHRLNYHPSAVARGFLHKRMNTLGIVAVGSDSAPLSSPYFAAVVNGIAAAAAAHHQNITLFTEGHWVSAQESLPLFADGRCDGFLLVGSHTQSDILHTLITRGLPCVLVNERSDDPAIRCVDVDDFASARTLTFYLIEQGHRRIGLLAPPDWAGGYVQRRRAGYHSALAAAAIPANPEWEKAVNIFQDSLREDLAFLTRLPVGERPSALLCADDMMAFLVMRDLRALGLRVPEDVSVVGFDDVWMAQFSHPALTTMRQPFDQIGDHAVRLLLDQVGIASETPEKLLVQASLVVRDSVAAMP